MSPEDWRQHYAKEHRQVVKHKGKRIVEVSPLGSDAVERLVIFARNVGKREYMRQLGRSVQQGLCPGLAIVGGKLPVLKRGKLRTLALREAQTVNWADPRANLYGVYPCPKCGEQEVRAAYKRPAGLMIECDSCGDKRPAHRVVQR